MELSDVRFGVGTHEPTAEPTGNRDMCIMEAVAFFAGEPWSDHPACASPVVSRFMQAWNDSLSDEDRNHPLWRVNEDLDRKTSEAFRQGQYDYHRRLLDYADDWGWTILEDAANAILDKIEGGGSGEE